MSAIDRLTRARDILVKLRDESTPGPWEANVYGGLSMPAEKSFPVRFEANYTVQADADLVSVLHAALPALIQVLDAAEFNVKQDKLGYMHATVSAALALADKVIGAAG